MSTAARLISIPYSTDSADWFCKIRHFEFPIWLDSGRPLSTYGRFDILSAAPTKTVTTFGKNTLIRSQFSESEFDGNPIDLLLTLLPPSQIQIPEVPFCGGLMGHFGYDLGRHFESLPEIANKDINFPDMQVGLYPWAIVQDHQLEHAWLVINEALDPAYNFSEIESICIATLKNKGFHDLKQNIKSIEKPFEINTFEHDLKVDEYRQAARKIKDYIAAGDCYQVNFAQRFSATCEGDSFEAYTLLRNSLPSPFSAYMEFGNASVLSLSPERFIKLQDGCAETVPIKGTIARGADNQEDLLKAATLKNSIKDRAENLMIVDLLRNDLSKTCTNVKVPTLFELQSFANVHHLVSTITGKLKPDSSSLELFSSCFPGGSITGAPKIRAMEIIEELEPTRRSIYCGSIGYFSACGSMDTNIAIRTLLREDNKIYCWGGGGIVADSKIDTEYEESLAKVRVLLNTLEKAFSS